LVSASARHIAARNNAHALEDASQTNPEMGPIARTVPMGLWSQALLTFPWVAVGGSLARGAATR